MTDWTEAAAPSADDIEALARDRLHMRMATPAITQWVTEDGHAVAMPVPEVVSTPAKAAR